MVIKSEELMQVKEKNNVLFEKAIKEILGEVKFIGARGTIIDKEKPYLTEDIGVFDRSSNYIEALTEGEVYTIIFDVTDEDYTVRSSRSISK